MKHAITISAGMVQGNPMSDLVQRLKAEAIYCHREPIEYPTNPDILEEAAAEIERLRTGVERVHAALQNPHTPRQSIGEMVAALLNPKE